MHQFKQSLTKGQDASTGLPVLGFEVKAMFIHDIFLSECGRFTVDPVATYGVSLEDAQALKQLNQGLLDATDDAINAGCSSLQTLLGVTDGGIAGVCFSGDAQRAPIAQALAEYLLTEVNSAQE